MDRGTASERARTWPQGRAAARFVFPPLPGLARFGEWFAAALGAALAAESAPGRLVPWMPVAVGLGIAAYFTAEHEPSWVAASMLAAAMALTAYLARRRPLAFSAAVLAAAAGAGF